MQKKKKFVTQINTLINNKIIIISLLSSREKKTGDMQTSWTVLLFFQILSFMIKYFMNEAATD